MLGSGRKTTSRVLGVGDWVLVGLRELAQSDFSETVFGGNAVLGINPSCRHFRHHDSKSTGAPAVGAPSSCGRFAGIGPPPTRSLPLAVLNLCACFCQ